LHSKEIILPSQLCFLEEMDLQMRTHKDIIKQYRKQPGQKMEAIESMAKAIAAGKPLRDLDF